MKSKTSQLDRLSDLPDSLIFMILWFLPMKYVVRTPILSRRWRNFWITTPYLNFSFDDVDDDVYDFPTFVDLALLSWKGKKVEKLKIDHRPGMNWFQVKQHFEVWMGFVVAKDVEELYLHWRHGMEHEPCMIPQCVYSCSSLKSLLIEGCAINIKGDVKWKELKTLRIERVLLEGSEQVFQKILCGSPRLEVLILALSNSNNNLSIQSDSLKTLSIDNYVEIDTGYHAVLKICSSKLETLVISGCPFTKCFLQEFSLLNDATLRLYGSGIDKCLKDILPAIKHAVTLTLSNECFKGFDGIGPQQFLNVKFLKIYACCEELNAMVDFLGIFPELNMLVLENENEEKHIDRLHPLMFFDDSHVRKLSGAKIPNPFLLQLRTFGIVWNEEDKSVFRFAERVLKYASKVDKIVIWPQVIHDEKRASTNSISVALQKLRGMQRSSTYCEFYDGGKMLN